MKLIQTAGYEEELSSSGDNLQSMCYRIYGSHSQINLNVLSYLNNRVDWEDLEVGTEIKYIQKDLLSQIDELW